MGTVNTETKPLEGEFTQQGVEETGLAVIPPNAVALSTVDPTEFLQRGVAQANALADLIKKKGLAINIGGGSKPHVLIDGWMTLMALNGVMPYTIESRQTRCNKEDCNVKPGCPGGRLTVHVVTEIRRVADGTVLTRVDAECSQHENRWSKADDYAVISMAQTRGVGKGCRQLFGWVMALAGFSSTPADEVPAERNDDADARNHNADVRAQGEGPVGARPMHPTVRVAPGATGSGSASSVGPAPQPARVPWSDEHRDGLKAIYKAVNAERSNDPRAQEAIASFAAYMNKHANGEWARLWANASLRAGAFQVFGMEDPGALPSINPNPTAAPDPTLPFDPDAVP